MRNWHPKGWSEQARELADRQIKYVVYGDKTIKEVLHFFSISYRADIIKYRAEKRFIRKIKKWVYLIKCGINSHIFLF